MLWRQRLRSNEDRALPKWGSTLPMTLEFKEEEETEDKKAKHESGN